MSLYAVAKDDVSVQLRQRHEPFLARIEASSNADAAKGHFAPTCPRAGSSPPTTRWSTGPDERWSRAASAGRAPPVARPCLRRSLRPAVEGALGTLGVPALLGRCWREMRCRPPLLQGFRAPRLAHPSPSQHCPMTGKRAPRFKQGAHDEALTPAGDTGDEDIDPGPIRLVLVEPRPIQGAAVREMLERVDDEVVVRADHRRGGRRFCRRGARHPRRRCRPARPGRGRGHSPASAAGARQRPRHHRPGPTTRRSSARCRRGPAPTSPTTMARASSSTRSVAWPTARTR